MAGARDRTGCHHADVHRELESGLALLSASDRVARSMQAITHIAQAGDDVLLIGARRKPVGHLRNLALTEDNKLFAATSVSPLKTPLKIPSPFPKRAH